MEQLFTQVMHSMMHSTREDVWGNKLVTYQIHGADVHDILNNKHE